MKAVRGLTYFLCTMKSATAEINSYLPAITKTRNTTPNIPTYSAIIIRLV